MEFINDYKESGQIGQDTQLTTQDYSGKAISAVALSNNKVFIAYYRKHDTSSIYLIYGIICIINDTEIIIESNNSITAVSSTMKAISATRLTDNKVFITFSRNSDSAASSLTLYGIVCEISGTEITVGTLKIINGRSYSGQIISVVALNENKVFIAHSSSSFCHLYGIVCTISGTEIATGMITLLNSESFSASSISVVALNENKVLIAHSVNKASSSPSSADYGFLYGMLCTIDDTEITVTEDVQLTDTNYDGYGISAVALTQNKVFITHVHKNLSTGSTDSNIRGIICTINDTEIVAGSDTILTDTVKTLYFRLSTIALSDSQVFITYNYDFTFTVAGQNHHLYGMLCRITNSEIIVEDNVLLSQNDDTASLGENISTTLINNKIFVSYSKGKYISEATTSNTNIYALVTNYVFQAIIQKVKNKYQKIEGVAKTNGSDGQLVKAVVPNFEESEEN